MRLIESPDVLQHIEGYPPAARRKLLALRRLIIDTIEQMSETGTVEECFKWGEPSYRSSIGSTLRMDWKEKSPDQCALYFNCNTRLIETFRLCYGPALDYEGNRAILLPLSARLPRKRLMACVRACLRYHQVKADPMLGL